MGNKLGLSASLETVQSSSSSSDSASLPGTNVRRKRSAKEAVSECEVEDISPRKKAKKTSDYIYETLFCQGQDSDIIIKALDKEWKLHKLYLKQSGYFKGMLSGSWKESGESRIEIDIPDLNITCESLDVAFSSLYRDLISLDEVNMCSTVAAASMLQLDGLLEQCRHFMKENISSDSVVGYYSAASIYGLTDVENECREWLLIHLLRSYTISLLKDIPLQLLMEILNSPNLFVIQIEMDIYSMVKKWLFLALNPDWVGNSEKLLGVAEDYFRHKGERDSYFLNTEEGKEYAELFRSLRLKHILNDQLSATVLEEDRIIPPDWLLQLYRQQWLQMLAVDQRQDPGPSDLPHEQFNKHSVRCGRVLTMPGDYNWRWTGYSFGFDILINYSTSQGVITLKRNTHRYPSINSVNLIPQKSVMVRLRTVSYQRKKKIHHLLDTGIKQLLLSPDEDCELLQNIPSSSFPMFISFNLLLTSTDTY